MLRRKIELCMTLLLLLGAIILSKKLSDLTTNGKVIAESIDVIIDAGHGGEDPGKVAVNGALEKDINLQIAKQIEVLLIEKGFVVEMTRTEDVMEGSKLADMKKRVEQINEKQPKLVVSIHQNSYTNSSVSGGQVFYYAQSETGIALATQMQEALRQVDPENTRQPKSNDSFYMLKKTKVPTIIVECGFLSNPQEAEKLITEEYQKQMAEAISSCIIKYLDK